MHNLTFGIEIETIGQTRGKVAQAIANVVGGQARHLGTPHCYDPWEVVAADGRRWKVMADSSLNASYDRQAEVVSPILQYEDIEMLQKVVRAVRKAGARVDASCGIHIHVGAAAFGYKAIRNLVKMVNKQELLIENALGVSPTRKARWCKGIDPDFLRKLESCRAESLMDLNIMWYGRYIPRPEHYSPTRYRGVNLHNIWYRGTIEFRWFEATLHAGKVKAYIQFILALSTKAIQARSASSRRRDFNPSSAKYDFRVFLLSLGLIGDEFKTARLHLLAGLSGSSAWKNGRPAATPEDQG